MASKETIIKTIDIKYQKTADLIPYVNNARIHTEKQVSQIAASIQEFGFNNPILCDGAKGVIAGHGRLMAAQKLKMDTVPVVELSHLSKAQKKAYILADNRLAELATWDDEMLQIEIEDIAKDLDITLMGFDLSDIKGMGEDSNTETEIDMDAMENLMFMKLGYHFDEYQEIQSKISMLKETPELIFKKAVDIA